MEPDNFAVHCDCQFDSLEDVRAAVGFWFEAVREIIEIVGDDGDPWHCAWSSATRPGSDDDEGLADLATLTRPPDVPTQMEWDAMLSFGPGKRPRAGREPQAPTAELVASPAGQSGTLAGAYEIEARIWLTRPWTRTEAAPIEQLLADRLRAFADEHDCSFACISDDLHDGLPLERAQRRSARAAREASNRYLRNYSWVTYCGPELTQSLHLPTGASVAAQVTRSAKGGTLLRFTSHLQDFVGDTVRRAADAVAAAIDPRPTTFRQGESSSRLLWSDGRAGPLPYDPSTNEST